LVILAERIISQNYAYYSPFNVGLPSVCLRF